MRKTSATPDIIQFVAPRTDIDLSDPAIRQTLERLANSVGARRSLPEVMEVVWEETSGLFPRDRISIAFVEDDGEMVISRFCRADYTPLFIDEDFHAGLSGSSLQPILTAGQARIISDLDAYLAANPDSVSTRLLCREKVASSMTLPLRVEGRQIGFCFISSKAKDAYSARHAGMMLLVLERISQAVEKSWIIRKLENARQQYMEMLGFVSHEMKSPLASLIARGESYTGGYLGAVDPLAKTTITRMMEIAGYLTGMIGNYLDLSRLESGQMRYAPRPGVCFKTEVLQFAIDTVSIRAEQRGSTITLDSPNEEITLTGDTDLLRIVMINLLDNAVKYGDQNIEVKVSLESKPEGLIIKVRNQGVGFTREQARGLFKRFSRLRQKGTEDRKGSGLGLYLTWWIIQQHQGRITADSDPGEWAEFTVQLPL